VLNRSSSRLIGRLTDFIPGLLFPHEADPHHVLVVVLQRRCLGLRNHQSQNGYSTTMLFMIIEHFKDVSAIGERFRAKGRMLPEGVTYQTSWIDPARLRCFQVMEASNTEALRPWLEAWNDLMDFEVVPVVTSAEFWSAQ